MRERHLQDGNVLGLSFDSHLCAVGAVRGSAVKALVLLNGLVLDMTKVAGKEEMPFSTPSL